MPVTITIHGQSAGEALAELLGFSQALDGPRPAGEPAAKLQAEPVPDSERKEFPPEPPRRTRAKKTAELEAVDIEPAPKQEVAAEPEAPLSEPAVDAAEPSAEPTPSTSSSADTATDDVKPEFSEDDARRALIDLGAQPDGKQKCRDVLTKFQATKLSEIPAVKRKEFIAEIARMRGIA